MGNITVYIIIALGVLLGAASGAAYWQYSRANGLQEDKVKLQQQAQQLEDSITVQKQTIADIQQKWKDEQANVRKLQETYNGTRMELERSRQETASYRSRIGKIVREKPDAVARLATDAVHRWMLGIGQDVEHPEQPGKDRTIPPADAKPADSTKKADPRVGVPAR